MKVGKREGMFRESYNKYTEIWKDLLIHLVLGTVTGVKDRIYILC